MAEGFLQYSIIFTILAKVTLVRCTQSDVDSKFVNIVDELLSHGGRWILAAGGSNGEMPEFESCIQVTITDTGKKAGCVLAAHNYRIQKIPILKFIGKNKSNRTEIISVGPVFQYMIKGRDEKKIDRELRHEVDWYAAVNSPICWHGSTREIMPTKYVITPIDRSRSHLYLVAISPKTPMPEYQVAILTRTIVRREHLEKITKIVNYRNFEKLEARSDRPGLFVNSSLPKVHMKCAEGYDPNSSAEKRYANLPQIFNKDSPPYPDTETLLVKHQ